MLISSTHFRNSTTRLVIFGISVGQMVIHPTKQTPTDDSSKKRPKSSSSGVFSALLVILVIAIESKHRSALVRINAIGRRKRRHLNFQSCCFLSFVYIKTPPTLFGHWSNAMQRFLTNCSCFRFFFCCCDEASSVGLWTMNFTVEADVHTHSNLTWWSVLIWLNQPVRLHVVEPRHRA